MSYYLLIRYGRKTARYNLKMISVRSLDHHLDHHLSKRIIYLVFKNSTHNHNFKQY